MARSSKVATKLDAGPERVLPELEPLLVPIESLNEDPDNPRIHDERNLGALRSSLSRFGQRAPLIVQKDGMVVRAGNARLRVARELGWKRVAAIVVDEPNLDAKAYAVLDNRVSDLSYFDDEALAKILEEIRNAQGDTISLEDAGYSSEKLDELLEKLAEQSAGPDDPNEHWQGMPEFEQEDLTPWKILKIYFRDEDAMRKFASLIEQSITDKTSSIWYPKEEEGCSVADQVDDES